jgi:hypothetical protein
MRPVNNINWTHDELADLHLLYPDWSAKHSDPHTGAPTRSYEAWRLKRRQVQQRQQPVNKAIPTVEVVAPEVDPRIAELMADPSDERLFFKYLDYHDEILARAPRLSEIKVGLDVDDYVVVANMSDWHIGAEGCDIRRLKYDLDLICNHPRVYAALGGDLADNFILDKMASASQASDAQVKVQWRLARYLLRPLLDSNSLLWVGSGNHDQWTQKVAHFDPVLDALKDVQVQYTGSSFQSEAGYVDLRVGSQTYTFFRKHRPSRFNSSFNRTHWLKQTLRGFLPREWDIGVVEHLHDMAIETFTYRRKKRIAICTGSYKIEDSYALVGGYYDGGYGVPCVLLSPRERQLIAFDNIKDALTALDGGMAGVKVVD